MHFAQNVNPQQIIQLNWIAKFYNCISTPVCRRTSHILKHAFDISATIVVGYCADANNWLCYFANMKAITQSNWLILSIKLNPFQLPSSVNRFQYQFLIYTELELWYYNAGKSTNKRRHDSGYIFSSKFVCFLLIWNTHSEISSPFY